MSDDGTSKEVAAKIAACVSLAVKEPPPAKPQNFKRRQFKPGQRLVDSRKREYWVDQNCSLRRVEGGKLTKAEKKAAKRARQASRRSAG